MAPHPGCGTRQLTSVSTDQCVTHTLLRYASWKRSYSTMNYIIKMYSAGCNQEQRMNGRERGREREGERERERERERDRGRERERHVSIACIANIPTLV